MLHEDGIENLRVAILRSAIKDYIFALKHDEKRKAHSLEQFFKSDWGELLSGNNGDLIITKCKERAKQ
jgi:hypothetical protein